MSLITQEAKDSAYNLLMYTLNKESSLSSLEQDQIRALIKLVHTVASESVILVKNKVNNL